MTDVLCQPGRHNSALLSRPIAPALPPPPSYPPLPVSPAAHALHHIYIFAVIDIFHLAGSISPACRRLGNDHRASG